MNKHLIDNRLVLRIVYDKLAPEDKYLINEDLFGIYQQVVGRRELFEKEGFISEEGLAKLILSCIPSEPLNDIKKRVGQRDPQAILAYADCFMHGLKRCEKNEMKAVKLYRQAAEMNLPEAMAYMAHYYYLKIYPFLRSPSIPRDCIYTDQAENLRKMWYWLEKSADLGWKSFTLRTLANDAQKTGSWDLSPNVKRLLDEIEHSEKLL
jgi:TPR repeat protein